MEKLEDLYFYVGRFKNIHKKLEKISGQMAVEHQMFFGFIFSNIFLKRNFSFSQDLSSASKNVFIAALKKVHAAGPLMWHHYYSLTSV